MSEPRTADALAAAMTREVQEWVRCRLKAQGETQTHLAARLGMTPQYLSELLHANNLSLRNVARFALALDAEYCEVSIRHTSPPL